MIVTIFGLSIIVAFLLGYVVGFDVAKKGLT